jgi:dipeptidyl aminopeptidase/acylaminoacyl peptidase
MSLIDLIAFRRLRAACIALAALALSSSWPAAQAQQAAAAPAADVKPLTPEEIWRLPTLADLTLSRTGRYLAATAPINGRMNLMVIDLDTRNAVALTNFKTYDVLGVVWVGDERLLFRLGQRDGPALTGSSRGGGLYMVSRDGKESRRISPTIEEVRANNQYVYRGLSFFRTIPGNDEEVIASGNLTDAESVDLYRLNVRTGRTVLLTSGRPTDRTYEWILDSKLVPRVVTAGVKDALTTVVYYRKSADSPWGEIARFEADKGPTFVPLAFESDDKTLQVATNAGRNTMAVYRYDPDEKKLGELIAQHPRFDMGADAQGGLVPGVIVDARTDKIIGYAVNADKPEVVWVDETRARVQKTLDAALPGLMNRIQRTPDGKRWLVTSYSDVTPVKWYLFDEEKRTLEQLGDSRPWLAGKQVEQRSFVFKSRDGIEMTGYYFLPRGYKPGTKLPTIVHIHGGPAARADSWGNGFGTREGQLFASHGYAVVVPNFRSTPGMGGRKYYAGFGSVGRQMLDDHEDAVKWAVEQGFADPQRVCISGASYGGYAALMGPVRHPGTYRCAIAGLAVTDFKYQLTSQTGDSASSEQAQKFWKGLTGAKDWDEPLVRQISPVFHADKIKIPVFMYAGRDDIRVPIDQINRMHKALADAGNPAKGYIVKPDEGHGFGKLENNVELYTEILKFLDEYLRK